MNPIKSLARPLVAAPFVVTGIETLRNPGPRAEQVAPLIKPLADRAPWLPSDDPETLVRIEGALSLGTGVLFALGRFQRLTTLLLAAQLVPAVLTEHKFWGAGDPNEKASERAQALKNFGLLGALLMVGTAPTKRRPVTALKHTAREAKLQAKAARADAGRRAERTRRKIATR